MKGLLQYVAAGALALGAALTVAQGDVGFAALGWVRASSEIAKP